MSKEKKLKEWIRSLDRETLEKVAFDCIDRLIDNEEVNYYPDDEDLGKAPYWDSCGIRLGEDE